MGLDLAGATVRLAARALVRTPAYTTLAILTLALGIGANSAIFSVVYGILERPLPYRDPQRLVVVQREQDLAGARRPAPVPFFSREDLAAWPARLTSLESHAFYAASVAALSTADGTDVIPTAVVSDSFFVMLGGPIAAGRPLGPTDDLTNSVVVSARLSQRLFGGAAAAPGRSLTLSSSPYVIVGVAAPAFQLPAHDTDVWMPYGYARSLNPRCCGMTLLGRLKAEATSQLVVQEAAGLGGRNERAKVLSLHDQLVGSVRSGLLILFAAAGLVLFAACVNVTNLVLTRQTARLRESAIRGALGASRARLIVERVVENLLLAGGGAAIGVALAIGVVKALVQVGASGLPRLDAVRVDLPVLLFSMVLAVVAAVFTGVIPSLRSPSPADALRSAAAYAVTPARAGRRVRGALCVAELAVSLVLLVGVGLLGRSLVRLLHTDLGVTTDRVATASLNMAFGGRPPDAQVLDRINRVIERVAALPGVQAAGVGTSLPPNASRIRLTLRRAGELVDYTASGVAATPGYFDALGMRLVKGRVFTAGDDLNHPPVMIMSVDTARRFFGDSDPIGKTMTLPALRNGVNKSEEMTLVGVVASVRYSGVAAAPDDAVYRPFAQQPWVAPFLVAQTAQDPGVILPALRREIGSVDRAIVVSDVRPLDAVISADTAQPRFRTVLLGGITGLAILVAAVGLFGVVAQSVSQRSRELGIRLALGARPDEIRWMVLREGAWLGLAGIALGAPAALAASRALTGLLYGIEPTDATSFVLASVGLLLVSLAASYVPALRASRVDPLLALRSE
jgi:predicted permease